MIISRMTNDFTRSVLNSSPAGRRTITVGSYVHAHFYNPNVRSFRSYLYVSRPNQGLVILQHIACNANIEVCNKNLFVGVTKIVT
jgi:hypothetical protein